MKLLLLQSNIVWGDPISNCANNEAVIDNFIKCGEHKGRGADVDLVLLPEMFSTGFCTEPKDIAEKDDYSLNWMKKIAHKYNCAICGSVAVEINETFYNRHYFVYPNGDEVHYDKVHLFSYSDEDKHFTAGSKKTIVEWRGWKFLLQTCYDLRFPLLSRNHLTKNPLTNDNEYEYDAIIYVASWPETRINAWNILLKARAIENQCYAIGVNRIGTSPDAKYNGNSAVIDFKGNILIECVDIKNIETISGKRTSEESVNEKRKNSETMNREWSCRKSYEDSVAFLVDIEKDKLIAYREKFPTLQDSKE